MNILNKVFYNIFFLVAFNSLCTPMDAIPMDLLGSLAPEKKLHNKIMSSVSGSVKKTEQVHVPSGLVEQKANRIDQDSSMNKNVFTIPDLPSIPKDIPETAIESKLAAPISDSAQENVPQIFEVESKRQEILSDQDTFSKSKEAMLKDTQVESGQKDQFVPEKYVLYQGSGFIDNTETVVFNFEETDLLNVANYMETIHNIKFISEDVLSTAKDAKGLSGHKVTFRTNKILTKKESWDLFLAFLHIAGLDVVPMSQVGFYKIVPFAKASSDTIPTYIGVDCSQLPDNDMVIRFVYFAQSVEPAKIQPVLNSMKSPSAKIETFTEMKALIFTDRACNIKSLMQIVRELDKSALPETLSVVKLKRANAKDVINLYNALKKSSSSSSGQQPQRAWIPGRKEVTLEYFPQDVATFSDDRTNSLILLGPEKGVKRIEEFIEKHIDVDIDRDIPEVYTYHLQYTQATDLAESLKSIIQYGSGTTAGQYGGVRDGMKFFSGNDIKIIGDKQTNSLVINASKEDYEALKPLIDELDVPQKQIGIEVLIVTVADEKSKMLGSQLSGPNGPHAPVDANKKSQTFAQSIAAQTASLSGGVVTTAGGVATNSPNYSIKSSLANLLGQVGIGNLGSLVVTFGQPIWSIFKVLNTISSTHIVANPFLVASNNTQANITIGTTRNIPTSDQTDSSGRLIRGFKQDEANLNVTITPSINKGNIINMVIDIKDESFLTSAEDSALKDTKNVSTTTSVANGEVLVLGGIMTERHTTSTNGVPFLENIPLFGWFFKTKTKDITRDHFLILICPKILESVDEHKTVGDFTLRKMNEANKGIEEIDAVDWFDSRKDPIQKAFFGNDTTATFRMLETEGRDLKIKKKKYRSKKRQRLEDSIKKKSVTKKELAKEKKNKDTLFEKPISFNEDVMKVEEDFLAPRMNSISTAIGQKGKRHV